MGRLSRKARRPARARQTTTAAVARTRHLVLVTVPDYVTSPPGRTTPEGILQMSITVYSKPACVQCTATTRALEAKGISFDLVDLTEDAAAMEMVQGLGYRQAPVVVAGEDHWAGFRPDLIGQLA